MSWSNSRKSESGSEVKQIHPIHGVWKSQKKSHFTTLRANTFWVDKSSYKLSKMANSAIFWKIEACGQIVLPDWWILPQIEMRHFWCFSNRSYFKIYWKYWKRKKLREKMCYFPLCCVRIGPKSNHQQSLSPIFFQMDKKRRWWRDFLFCQTESFLVFQRAFLARRRLSFFRRRTAFPINWKLPVHLAWHCC